LSTLRNILHSTMEPPSDTLESRIENVAKQQIHASQVREAVLQKFKNLKSTIRHKEESLEKFFKPVTKALKGDEKKKVRDATLQTESNEARSKESPISWTPQANETGARRKIPNLSELEPRNLERELDETEEPKKKKGKSDRIVAALVGHTPRSRDKTYAPRYIRESDVWVMGNEEIEFSQDHIRVHQSLFPKTRGLLELLFEKEPRGYTLDDKENYIRIMTLTDALITKTGEIKGPHFTKYRNFIGPMMNDDKRGSGIKRRGIKRSGINGIGNSGGKWKRDYGPCPTDYKYYSNPVKLVDRLILLLAAREAGHGGHQNEILEIETELRKRGVLL
jgi:hypothetical protein